MVDRNVSNDLAYDRRCYLSSGQVAPNGVSRYATDAIDQAELERAQWLWKRRPRYVLFDGGKVLWGRFILYILTILFLVSFDIPGLLAASGLSFVVAILVLFDYYWRERWRRDYDVSLCRLIKRYLF